MPPRPPAGSSPVMLAALMFLIGGLVGFVAERVWSDALELWDLYREQR